VDQRNAGAFDDEDVERSEVGSRRGELVARARRPENIIVLMNRGRRAALGRRRPAAIKRNGLVLDQEGRHAHHHGIAREHGSVVR